MSPVPKAGDLLLRLLHDQNVVLYRIEQSTEDANVWVFHPLFLSEPPLFRTYDVSYVKDFVLRQLSRGSLRLLPSPHFCLFVNV